MAVNDCGKFDKGFVGRKNRELFGRQMRDDGRNEMESFQGLCGIGVCESLKKSQYWRELREAINWLVNF